MTKLIENLKASIFVSTLTKNLSMYSRFDAPKFGCVNGCMLFILYYRVNRIGENRNFEILALCQIGLMRSISEVRQLNIA
ncbi:hypothetical protein [Staphylococcus aureus]|uniref:hypothetical protein n=1 Tax=Staphylococcus aureus TaxID=1280 RepID=UPI0037DA0AD4